MKSYTWLHAVMGYRNEWSVSAWRLIGLVWEREVQGRLTASKGEIAGELGLSERHIRRAIGELRTRGLLKSGYGYVEICIERNRIKTGHPVSGLGESKPDISRHKTGHPVSGLGESKPDISRHKTGHPVSGSSLYTTIPLSDDEDLIVDSRDPETSSPSSAPGSTFGENRIADLSFENNINNSEDPASPDAPTPPLPPLAPGEELPADWPDGWPRSKADFEQWVLDCGMEHGCPFPMATTQALHMELSRQGATLEQSCRYVIHTLSNMDGEDKGKIKRALVKPQRIREGLRQLREEAAAKEITIDDLSTDPAQVERRQQERERRQREEFERDSKQPLTPDQLVAAEKGWKFIEEMKARKALRQELLDRESQRESA